MAMTLRLSDRDEQLVATLAEAYGVSAHEAVLRAIRSAAQQRFRSGEVRRLSTDARDRYADLIERLGQ